MTARKREEAAVFLRNLAEFLGGSEDNKEELISSLKARGIDTDAALSDFKRVLDKHAPVWQEEAGTARRAALRDMDRSIISPTSPRAAIVETIDQIVAAMQSLGASIEAGAYHREFREATDEDLRSLAADLKLQLESLKRQK